MDFSVLSNNYMNHGHDIKLTQDYYTTTTELFSNRSITQWNNLSDSKHKFKNRLDNHWYISRHIATTKG